MICAALSLALWGCDREIGDWDPIKWESDIPAKECKDCFRTTYKVELLPDSGVYNFSSVNYPLIWLETEPSRGTETIATDWLEVSVVKKNTLSISVDENKSGSSRVISFGVTVGDTGCLFEVSQKSR